jgi:hypothetical protein
VARPRITLNHQTVFLAALAAGKTRGVAARLAHKGLTGTAFRGLEHRDPKFAQKVAAATREGALERLDLIDGEFEKRAFDPEKPNLRALELLAATHHPDYLWMRRGGGASGHESELGGTIDPELLTRDQLAQLVHLVKMGQGLEPNPELRAELEAAPMELTDGKGVVIAKRSEAA